MGHQKQHRLHKERRLLLLGDPSTGKTSLLRSADCEVQQPDPGLPTVYYKFLEGGKRGVLLGLWDAPSTGLRGREALYPRLDAVILVFALDSPQTLYNARKKWYKEVSSRTSNIRALEIQGQV